MGPKSQVPLTSISSDVEANFQLFEPRETIIVWFISINVRWSLLFYAYKFSGLVLRVGISFVLDPTLNTSLKPHLQKVQPCRHPCHTWDFGLGTCVKWRVPTTMLSTIEIAQIDLKWLGAQDLGPVWISITFDIRLLCRVWRTLGSSFVKKFKHFLIFANEIPISHEK
jgi:hypothetical protein